jgi:sulfonate transport system permease protein
MNSQRLKWLSETRWLSPILLLTLWEMGSRTGVIPERTLAAPSSVVSTMLAMIVSGELPHNLAISLVRASIGLSIGIFVGVVLGLAAGLSVKGNAAIDPLLQIKRTIPVVALSPLFIVWFGIGETTKIALIAFATMLPIYLNLYEGIRGVDVRLIDAARSFGLSRWALIRDVILPATLPSLIVGIRYSLSIAVLMLVIAEQINATAGLGYLINNARDFMRTDIIVVCLLVYALLGLAGDLLMRIIERRVLAWRPSVMELRA